MNPFAIGPLIVSLLTLSFGFLVLFKNKREALNRLFSLLCMSVFIWAFGYSRMYSVENSYQLALFWARIGYIGVVFIPVFTYHYIIIFLQLKKHRFMLFSVYLFGIIFLFISRTNLFLYGGRTYFWGYYPQAGPFYIFFVLFFAWIFIRVVTLLFLGLRHNKLILLPLQVNRIKYVLFGFAIATTSLVDYISNYGIEIYPWAYLSALGWLICMGWASFRYRLMDIKLAVTKFGIFAFVYALVLGLPFGIGWKGKDLLFQKIGTHWWLFPLTLSTVLATLGPFIYLKLEKRSKELLYKIEFKRYETLRKFSKTLLLIKELDKLLELIVYRLVKTLRVNYAGIYLYDKQNDAYLLKSYRPLLYPNLPKEALLNKNDSLIKLLYIWRKELVREEIKNMPLPKHDHSDHVDFDVIQNRMHQISATVIIPHFIENDLLGFLVLGDKERGTIYTEEDISILSGLSNSAALAIENALFLIDLKITQAELFNAKRIAELGYMASAMGHEINNRLQAIYSAAFDMTDNPIVHNVIKDNLQAKEVFEKDINHINENVEDATAIINELKTYARPQDKTKQNFELLNLKEVIDKALRVVRLQSSKAFEMIDLDISMPGVIPKISGNFIQLQQVFVNLFNNAHDAIIEKKSYIEQHPELGINAYKGKIQVNAVEVKNTLDIHIIDNGMGMTEEIKKRLFIPLYTSKASSDRKAQRDIKGGTGIGLYTIQTIVRGHNGAISVYDTERLKGTDFLLTLPVARGKERISI